MSSLSIDDVEPLEGRRFSISRLRGMTRRPLHVPDRREFIKGAIEVGAVMSVGFLGLARTARPALAQEDPSILAPGIWEGCAGLGDWVTDDNCDGCNRAVSTIMPCTHCCNSDGNHKYYSADCRYARDYNRCKGSGTYYGWTWSVGTCSCTSRGNCPSGCWTYYRNRRWRCTDGHYRTNCTGAGWTKSVCRYQESAGSRCDSNCFCP
jgi:hypothetical protein